MECIIPWSASYQAVHVHMCICICYQEHSLGICKHTDQNSLYTVAIGAYNITSIATGSGGSDVGSPTRPPDETAEVDMGGVGHARCRLWLMSTSAASSMSICVISPRSR